MIEGKYFQKQALSPFEKSFNEKVSDPWKIEADPNMLKLDSDAANKGLIKLGDVYQNKNFFAAYPHAKDIPIKIDTRSKGAGGYARRDKKTGLVTEIGLPAAATREDYLTALQHELQHFVQGEEKFPFGATSENMSYKDYLATSGEVEARNASQWLNFPEEVKGRMPTETYNDLLELENMTSKDIIVRNNRAGISNAPKLSPEEYKAMQDYINSSSLRGGKRANITWSDEKINDFRKVMQQFDKSWNAREAEASEKFGITKASVRGLYNKFDVKYSKAQ